MHAAGLRCPFRSSVEGLGKQSNPVVKPRLCVISSRGPSDDLCNRRNSYMLADCLSTLASTLAVGQVHADVVHEHVELPDARRLN
jgi:hypothetical protein